MGLSHANTERRPPKPSLTTPCGSGFFPEIRLREDRRGSYGLRTFFEVPEIPATGIDVREPRENRGR